ncbi:uncharacterized protein PGTG_04029 [Puccinia graminis f. sp. tritici CRL 75-36-700-3]|uniref:Uncharacterized protein n=1 Tax=Puccinia graminis f. sp. tritici (strain CRL 75-36-700-3 / race SCCL) TaxID=418459 RepID=E3K198_PUCGT|nr:uncharacterized protein PGTG_04029 [Puccinia graminis f. sp. tritici CRL 75-36-700-3]EFP78073.2 hypothetical protein PGTG_04029 [Puccinia graminis f. sp. tritici CRL 75-36-700-3]
MLARFLTSITISSTSVWSISISPSRASLLSPNRASFQVQSTPNDLYSRQNEPRMGTSTSSPDSELLRDSCPIPGGDPTAGLLAVAQSNRNTLSRSLTRSLGAYIYRHPSPSNSSCSSASSRRKNTNDPNNAAMKLAASAVLPRTRGDHQNDSPSFHPESPLMIRDARTPPLSTETAVNTLPLPITEPGLSPPEPSPPIELSHGEQTKRFPVRSLSLDRLPPYGLTAPGPTTTPNATRFFLNNLPSVTGLSSLRPAAGPSSVLQANSSPSQSRSLDQFPPAACAKVPKAEHASVTRSPRTEVNIDPPTPSLTAPPPPPLLQPEAASRSAASLVDLKLDSLIVPPSPPLQQPKTASRPATPAANTRPDSPTVFPPPSGSDLEIINDRALTPTETTNYSEGHLNSMVSAEPSSKMSSNNPQSSQLTMTDLNF